MTGLPISKPEGPAEELSSVLILIDGSNVAHNGSKKPLIDNLVRVLNELKRRHIRSITLIESKLRYTIDQPQILENMIDGNTVIQVPAQRTADDFLLKLNRQLRDRGWIVYILSNDLFRDAAKPGEFQRIAFLTVTCYDLQLAVFSPELETLRGPLNLTLAAPSA